MKTKNAHLIIIIGTLILSLVPLAFFTINFTSNYIKYKSCKSFEDYSMLCSKLENENCLLNYNVFYNKALLKREELHSLFIEDSITAVEVAAAEAAASYNIESNTIEQKTDIAYIINTFISNCSDGYAFWGLYNNNEDIEKYDKNIVSGNISPYQLRFNGYLTMDGKAIFNDDVGNTGEWCLSLNGPRAGANILYIGSIMLYTHPSLVCDYLKKKLFMSEYSTINKSDFDYSSIFKVKDFHLKFIYSMGNNSGSVSIFISKDINEIISLDL